MGVSRCCGCGGRLVVVVVVVCIWGAGWGCGCYPISELPCLWGWYCSCGGFSTITRTRHRLQHIQTPFCQREGEFALCVDAAAMLSPLHHTSAQWHGFTGA